MNTIGFLLVFPLVPAILLGLIPSQKIRVGLVWLSSLLIAAASVFLTVQYIGQGTQFFAVHIPWLEHVFFGAEVLIGVYLLYRCKDINKSEWWIPVLIAAQLGIGLYLELAHKLPEVANAFYVDSFSLIMVLIIGLIGTLIIIYALNYMRDYHAHHGEVKDRRRFFFFLLFLFLTGMFGVVLSNNLSWLFLFWEITTLCSFEMIGYSQTGEARRNSYRALGLNSLGGLAFAVALLYLCTMSPERTLELSALLSMGAAVAMIPAVLISFAGLTKSAQMPFSSWLLGAMIAPTPVSALLHSSTMVKAGVFVVVKFAPVLQDSTAGLLIALVGGITFLMTSLLAVTQSNAKRVLAYSTIANLGLVVMCAGVGTSAAIWAAIMLIVFHAIAKGLLFLTVGTIEHKIGSRDIEDMGGLLVSRPWLGMMIVVGILGMFLAPFGMLISKWVCIEALLDSSTILAILLAFGSAPTLFFWSKWLGKIVMAPLGVTASKEKGSFNENSALAVLAVMTVAVCALFPLLSSAFIEPYLYGLNGTTFGLESGNLVILFLMLALVVLLPLSFLLYKPKAQRVATYLAGANISGKDSFTGSMGLVQSVGVRNYYLTGFLEERGMTVLSVSVTTAVLAVLLGVIVL